MTTKLPRYTPVLVAAPAPPPPHAAPAPAVGEDGRDLANRLFNQPGVAGITAADSLAIHAIVDRAEAAEAERDRLALELAALRGAMPLPNTSDAKTLDGLDTIEARAKRVIADTDADSDRNDCGHQDRRRFLAADILRLVRLARALATATAPPAAEAVTGGEGWIPVADRMPSPEMAVLVSLLHDVNYQGRYDPKTHPVKRLWTRAMWVPKFHRECDGDFDDFGESEDYDEAGDRYYWPEGWYETPLEGERYWILTEREYTVTHWTKAPALDTPQEADHA